MTQLNPNYILVMGYYYITEFNQIIITFQVDLCVQLASVESLNNYQG